MLSIKYKQSLISFRYFLFLQLIIMFFLLFSAIAHKEPLLTPIILYVYQFLAVFFVGFATMRFLRVQTQTLVSIVALSYGLGDIVSLLTYLLSMLLFGRNAILYITIIEVLISIWYVSREH